MIDRRRLLQGAAGLAAARFLIGGAMAQGTTRPRLESDPFALGVASGEPTTGGFVLWTRIAGLRENASPAYEIAADEAFDNIVRAGRTIAPLARGGAVHLEVDGLQPGRPYFYRFHLGDAVSRTGRTATIAKRPDRVRLALTSCQHWEQGFFTAYADMIANDVEAVLQVGDYIYEKSFGAGPDVRSFGAPVPHSLDDYRARHALYRTDPHLAAAHAAMPFIVTWDDHEVENDYAGVHGAAAGDTTTFVKLRAAAYQAYFEHMPLRPSAFRQNGELRLYRRFGWGDLANVHVLDSRQYRTPLPCSTAEARGSRIVDRCGEALDTSTTMLGAPEERWLKAGMAREQARWSLIAQQTLFSRLNLPAGPDARYSDIWDGYAATRDRAIDALTQPAVRNPVLLGGDVHSFWINDVKRDFSQPYSVPVATEIVPSCLASRNGPEALFGPAQSLNPHVRFLDNHHAGYVLLDVTPGQLDIDLRAVADLADSQSVTASLARYLVENGRPGAQRA